MQIEIGELLSVTTNLFTIASSTFVKDEIAVLCFDENLLIARNENIQIEARLQHDIERGAVPFEKLQQLLTRYNPSKKIDIYSEDKKLFVVDKRRNKAIIPYVEFEFAPQKRSKKWKRFPEEFFDGLSICQISLAKESLNWIFTYFGIFEDHIVSTDERRITRYDLSKNSFSSQFSLPLSTIEIIRSMEFSKYSLEEKAFQAKTKNGIFYIKTPLVSEKYPIHDDSIFKTKNSISVEKSIFTDALRRSAIFAKGESKKHKEADISFREGRFEIKARNEFGENKETGRLKTSANKRIEIKANPEFLLDIIEKIRKKILTLNISRHDRIVFSEENFSHAIAATIKKAEK